MHKIRLSLVFFLFLGWVMPGLARGQSIHLPPAVRQGPDTSTVPVTSSSQQDHERAAQLAELRQGEIRRDSEKLLELSTELKLDIEKSGPGTLSVDAARKAEKIEKLARSIKSKLKQSY